MGILNEKHFEIKSVELFAITFISKTGPELKR